MKISYHARQCKNTGTIYNQAISMTQDQLEELVDKVIVERYLNFPRRSEYINTSGYETYLQPLQSLDHKIYFLNLTQTRFINLFCKLPLKNRNTCIIIKP